MPGNPVTETDRQVGAIIGARIRHARQERNLNRCELVAKIASISISTLMRTEAGRTRLSIARLVELAGALDMPVAFFVEDLTRERGDEPMPPRLISLYHQLSAEKRAVLIEVAQALAGVTTRTARAA